MTTLAGLQPEPAGRAAFDPLTWAYWIDGAEPVRVLRMQELWGSRSYEVYSPATQRIHFIADDQLTGLDQRQWTAEEMSWRAAALKIIHLGMAGEPLALASADIEALPHQIRVLERCLALDPVRLLLADEVGLGKTIEAGLVYSELKRRGKVRRVLVVAPKGVQLQWVAEMRRFGEDFARVGPEGVPVDVGIDPWRAFDRVVCSPDAVKPLRRRHGWSAERIHEHNAKRHKSLVGAGWDLVILDEAHHFAGSTEDVARHTLALDLARASPHLLLLSATPHSGKTRAFGRLLGLLSPSFLLKEQILKAEVEPFVVRTEKREAVAADGTPLFRPRTTKLEVVPYGKRESERALYEAVSDYVRTGYGRARKQKRFALGFLLLLMQRLVSSSTAAILAALERRRDILQSSFPQLAEPVDMIDDWSDLTGEEQVAMFHGVKGVTWPDEAAEVGSLVKLAQKASADGIDAKASFVLELVRAIRREEGDPSIKVVIFTEFVATQEMLLAVLDGTGIKATAINGGMNLTERSIAQDEFREKAEVLVSTDAGGEGINLQFGHVVINYDLPWNPMRIEQRIGRVDRIGQLHPVRAYNLVLENSVDARVIGVLEAKLWKILAELGADKWGDVLESASRGVEDVYVEAIQAPNNVDKITAALTERTRNELAESESLRLLIRSPTQGPVAKSSEIGHWLTLTAAAYKIWKGREVDDPLELLDLLPETSPLEPVPVILGDVPGFWSLWELRGQGLPNVRDSFAVFVSDSGAVRPDLADRLWRRIAEGAELVSTQTIDGDQWSRVTKHGTDFAYGASHAFRRESPKSPWLALRLLVRTQT